MDQKQKLLQELKKINIELDDKQCGQFIDYHRILTEWNEFMNLTGITEYSEVVMKHFVDSLALTEYIDLNKNLSVLDLGTGAGFPGVPLKIAFEKLNITLLDSLNKRIKFLNEVINQLGLKEIDAIHGRAEELGKNVKYRESYDLCVSRAVSNLATLSEYCIPFVKKGGYFIAYKSGQIEEELEASKRAIAILGGKIERVETFALSDTDMQRSFVFIKKVKETPKAYPRTAGKPGKEPLK